MIDVFTFTTPNGKKIPIACEELGLAYEVHMVDLKRDEQHQGQYLAINPNGKIPAIIDRGGPGNRSITIFESGAILMYLAEKAGKLLPSDAGARFEVLEWLFFQVSAVGPFFGQLGKWKRQEKRNEEAIAAFTEEVRRELGVLEKRLAKREYLCDAFSIADISTFTWVSAMKQTAPELLDAAPSVAGWLDRVAARPAVVRGMDAAKWPMASAARRVPRDVASHP